MLMPIAAAIEPIRMSRLRDVRELVGEDAAELALVQDLQDALRDGDRRVLRAAAVANALGCCMSET